jgi:DNA-binding NtrC family response regulator
MIWIDCARTPRGLLEEELFGDAGAWQAARGGSLYLEGIDALPLELQRRLASALGEPEQTDPSVPRLIASTSRDPRRGASRRRFHGELLGRFSRTPIRVARLRERREDILPLAHRFLRITDLRLGRPEQTIAPEAGKLLLRGRWRGNIHELVDVMERSAGSEGAEIGLRDLRERRGFRRGAGREVRRPGAGRAPLALDQRAKARSGFSQVIRWIASLLTPEEASAGRNDSTRYA